MNAHGRISIRELQTKSIDIEATQQDGWVMDLLRLSAPKVDIIGIDPEQWAQSASLSTKIRLEKIGGDYMITGDLKGEVLSPCSRCAEPFPIAREASFRLFLVPKNSGTSEEASDDPDYVFFSGDSLSLPEILSEQLIVQEAVAECPRRKNNGTCSFCGKNPQFSLSESGQGTKTLATSLSSDQLEKLKALKLR